MGEEAKKKRARWKLIVNIVTFAALGILIFFTRKQIVDTFHNLSSVNASLLLLMIPLQIWNYDAYTRMYRHTLSLIGEKVSYKNLYRTTLELNFVNHVFPSGGVSGFSYFSLRLKSFGVPGAKSTLAQIMRFILIFASFEVLLVVGLLMLAIGGQAGSFMLLISGSLATALLIVTLGGAYMIGTKSRIDGFFSFATKSLNKLIHVFRRDHPETINIERARKAVEDLHTNYMILRKDIKSLKRPFIFALFANFTEIACIYVTYLAFGHWVNPGAVIIAYAIANFAGLISIFPGGVGVYEALMTATLAAAGVPPAVSLPVTVMYRILAMVLQLPIGYFFYSRFMNKERLAAPK